MVTEDYVSFETAKLLKEKGFNEDSWFHYDTDGNIVTRGYRLNRPDDIPAWTHQMAMKWMREVYNLHIQSEITAWPRKGYFVGIYLYKNRHNNFEKVPFVEYKDSYEEACEAGIKYCLENLI